MYQKVKDRKSDLVPCVNRIDTVPTFGSVLVSPFIERNIRKFGVWEPHLQMIAKGNGPFKVLTSRNLTDKQWTPIDLSFPDANGYIDPVQSRIRVRTFRAAIRNRFGSRETIMANGYGVHTASCPDGKNKFVLAVAKVAFTKKEIVYMFEHDGRGKGRLRQVLSIRTKLLK